MNRSENGRGPHPAPPTGGCESSGPGPDDPRVIAALEEYQAAMQAGRAPDRQAFLARHPDIAPALAQCLGGLEWLRGAAPAPGPADGGGVGPGVAVGDFHIVREIGRGGMGVVYEAEQLSLGRRVALKVLPFAAALDARQLLRFKNEAHAAAQLHHTNIVPVYGVGQERGVHYYAMQLIDGQSLAAVLHQLRQLAGREASAADSDDRSLTQVVGDLAAGRWSAAPASPAEQATGPAQPVTPAAVGSTGRTIKDAAFFRLVARLGVQAAEGLEHAHQLGVIHRDVKPGNLLVDVRGNLWITDFGLAQCRDQGTLTATGDLVGTLRYMSPEQALARRGLTDHRTDIYSLGVTLYELLTLEPVFPGRDREELLKQITFEEPRPLRRLNWAVPAELEIIVLKALEKNPAERYATAQEMADDLRYFLDDRPIRARRPTVLMRGRKWVRRHQAVVWSLAASFLLFLLVTLAGLTVGLVVLNDERERTQEALDKTELARQEVVASQKKTAEAAQAERRANELAQKRLGRYEKTTEILVAIFKDLDPRAEQKGGPPLVTQLGQHLEQATEQIDAEAVGDALVVARLQTWLGAAHVGLGYPERAIPLHLRATKTFEQILGPDDPLTLRSRHDLAAAYLVDGRLDQAIALNEKTLEKMKVVLGSAHANTLASMSNLAMAYQRAGQFDKGIPLGEEVAEKTRVTLGPGHPTTLSSMGNLALAYQRAGRPEKAIPLCEQARALMVEKYGPDHPSTLAALNNLALAYDTAGRHKTAIPFYEQAARGTAARLGPDHPQTLLHAHNLAVAYAAAGERERGIALSEQTLTRMRDRLGPDHSYTLGCMNALANRYREAGRLDEAIALHKETLERRERKLGPNAPDTVTSIHNLALTYRAAGRHELALPLFEQAVERGKVRPGPDHPNTLQSMAFLAREYLHAGRTDKGIPLLEQTLQKMKAKLRPDHHSTLSVTDMLVEAYFNASRWEAAIGLLQETIVWDESHLGPDHPRTLTAMYNLGCAHGNVGQLDEAVSVLRQAMARMKKRSGPDDAQSVEAMTLLGWTLLRQQKYAEAEPLLRDALAAHEKKAPAARTFHVRALLGACLLGRKQYAAAEPLLLSGYEGMKRHEVTIPPEGKGQLTKALERLVRLYEEWDKKDEAARWRTELDALRQAPARLDKRQPR
jgi:serine/threonine protein kinase